MMAMDKNLSLFLFCILLPIISTRAHNSHLQLQYSAMDFLEPLVGTRIGDSSESLPKLKNHLSKLGYLNTNTIKPLSSSSVHNNLFDETLEEALTKYQSFFKLPTTGILDAATLAHMRKPRCGVPDHPHNTSAHYAFFPGNPKWPVGKRQLTYSFPPGTRNDALTAIQHATDMWAKVSPFKFQYTKNYDAADIKISFQTKAHGDGQNFDGPEGILAHADVPTGGKLHFDGDEKWVDGVVAGAFDLQTIGLHELGHVLGLDHSTDGGSIMTPSFGSGSRKGLNKDDIGGIKALYG